MMFRHVLELIFPHRCVLCRQILSKDELDLCRKCRVDSPEYDGRGQKIRFAAAQTAVWYYEGNPRNSLLRYKFHNARSYADAYGRLLAMRILTDLQAPDVITWVPVSARRRRKRGYDQVELLARAVSRELEIPCESMLEKFRDNKPNSSLKTPEERAANVLGVYRTRNEGAFRGKRVLLLDDIITTGATASECARVLRTAGAEEVICAAVAAGRKQK